MCLAMMGPGDTAIVPAPYFPIHVYSVALASGNVIALEVRDSDKFLSNIAYTCEHLYPAAEAASSSTTRTIRRRSASSNRSSTRS